MTNSLIVARDLPEAWFLMLKEVLSNGYQYKIDRGSYVGQYRKQLLCCAIEIKYPGTRPIIPSTPEGIPAPSTMEYIEQYLPYLITGGKKVGEQYTYGQYLESQIEAVIEMFKKDGFNTNQAFMAVGDASSILLKDPPCLRGIDVKIVDGVMHFYVYFRSWDLWAGFPSNLAAIQLLKEYMSSSVNAVDGKIFAFSGGLHLYEYSWDLAKGVVRV